MVLEAREDGTLWRVVGTNHVRVGWTRRLQADYFTMSPLERERGQLHVGSVLGRAVLDGTLRPLQVDEQLFYSLEDYEQGGPPWNQDVEPEERRPDTVVLAVAELVDVAEGPIRVTGFLAFDCLNKAEFRVSAGGTDPATIRLTLTLRPDFVAPENASAVDAFASTQLFETSLGAVFAAVPNKALAPVLVR
ncbi:MAG: hypothetical protein R3F34_08890 [Planctomycetota bacterium]